MVAIRLAKKEESNIGPRIKAHSDASDCYIATSDSPGSEHEFLKTEYKGYLQSNHLYKSLQTFPSLRVGGGKIGLSKSWHVFFIFTKEAWT